MVLHTRLGKPLGLVAALLNAYEQLCVGNYALRRLSPGSLGFDRSLEVTYGSTAGILTRIVSDLLTFDLYLDNLHLE